MKPEGQEAALTDGELLRALRGILDDLARVRAARGWRFQRGALSVSSTEIADTVTLFVKVPDRPEGAVAAVWPVGATPDPGGLLWCVLRARDERGRRRDGTLTVAEHEVMEVMSS